MCSGKGSRPKFYPPCSLEARVVIGLPLCTFLGRHSKTARLAQHHSTILHIASHHLYCHAAPRMRTFSKISVVPSAAAAVMAAAAMIMVATMTSAAVGGHLSFRAMGARAESHRHCDYRVAHAYDHQNSMHRAKGGQAGRCVEYRVPRRTMAWAVGRS